LPLRIDRLGVGLKARVKVLDIGGIAAVEKRGKGECGVRVLARHGGSSSEPELRGEKRRAIRRNRTRAKNRESTPPGAGDFSFSLFNSSMRQAKDETNESRFPYFRQRLTEPRRRRRDLDSRRFHGGDLGLGIALAAGDDRTGVSHPPSGRSGASGDKADHRLVAAALGFVLEKLRRVLL